MHNNEFIKYYTNNKCITFDEFKSIADKYGIYFEKIGNEFITCYSGEGNWLNDSFEFYKSFFPDTELTPSSFNLITSINNFHKKFIIDKINNIYKSYGLPPRYNSTISFVDNGINLLNILKLRYAIKKEDIEFIKYLLSFQ